MLCQDQLRLKLILTLFVSITSILFHLFVPFEIHVMQRIEVHGHYRLHLYDIK